MSGEDPELQSIKEKKLVDMMRRTRAQLQSAEKYDGKPIILSDTTFSSEISKYPLVVVDFWAPWCGPCRMVSPIVEELSIEYGDSVRFHKMNTDDNENTMIEYGITSIPTLIIFKDGREVNRLVGFAPKEQLRRQIDRSLA